MCTRSEPLSDSEEGTFVNAERSAKAICSAFFVLIDAAVEKLGLCKIPPEVRASARLTAAAGLLLVLVVMALLDLVCAGEGPGGGLNSISPEMLSMRCFSIGLVIV